MRIVDQNEETNREILVSTWTDMNTLFLQFFSGTLVQSLTKPE